MSIIPVKVGKWIEVQDGWMERPLAAAGYCGFEARKGGVYQAAFRKCPADEPHICLNGDEFEHSPEFDRSYKAQSWFREHVREALAQAVEA